MATSTSNLGLIKPAGTDHALVSNINTNSDKIDAEAGNVRSNFALVQNGDTATQAISKDQLVVWKGVLKKASANIASGATLSSSNLSDDTIAAELSALNSKIADKFLYASTIQDIANVIPNSQDSIVVSGGSALSAIFGLTTGACCGLCVRVLSSTTNRIDFFFFKQNGVFSIGNVNLLTNAVTYRLWHYNADITNIIVWNSGLTFPSLKKAHYFSDSRIIVSATINLSGFVNGNTIATIPANALVKSYSSAIIDNGSGTPVIDNIGYVVIDANSKDIKGYANNTNGYMSFTIEIQTESYFPT